MLRVNPTTEVTAPRQPEAWTGQVFPCGKKDCLSTAYFLDVLLLKLVQIRLPLPPGDSVWVLVLQSLQMLWHLLIQLWVLEWTVETSNAVLLFPAFIDHLEDMWIHLEGSSPKDVQQVDRIRPESGFVVPSSAQRVIRFAGRWQVVAAAEVEPGFAFLKLLIQWRFDQHFLRCHQLVDLFRALGQVFFQAR